MAKHIDKAVLEIVAAAPAGIMTEEICQQLEKTPQDLGEVFERHLAAETLLGFAGLWFTPESFEAASGSFLAALDDLHQNSPSDAWHSRERAADRAGLDWRGKPLDRIVAALVEAGKLGADSDGIRNPAFLMNLTKRQQAFLNRVTEELNKELVNTLNAYELSKVLFVPRQAVDEVLKLGVLAGEIIELEDGVLYTPTHFPRLSEALRTHFGKKPFAASEARDALGTSRRYVIPLLEHLDGLGLTRWVDEEKRVVEDPVTTPPASA